MGFPACSNRLSRTVEKPFPCYRKCISTLLFGNILIFKRLCFVLKNCVYGGGMVAVRFWAILSDFASHEYSFFHNHIAWICVFTMRLLFGFSSVGQPVLSVSSWLSCRVACFLLWHICFIFHFRSQPVVCFTDDLLPFSGLLLFYGCLLLFSSPVGAFII